MVYQTVVQHSVSIEVFFVELREHLLVCAICCHIICIMFAVHFFIVMDFAFFIVC